MIWAIFGNVPSLMALVALWTLLELGFAITFCRYFCPGLPIRAGFCIAALARDLARSFFRGCREESVVERGCAAHQLVADLTDVLTQP